MGIRNIKVEPGLSYTDARGFIVTILRTLPNNRYLGDNGKEYTQGGYPTGQNRSPDGPLNERAQPVLEGDVYDVHWEDAKSVGRYRVDMVGEQGYHITWSNGAELYVKFGCGINKQSIRVNSSLFTIENDVSPLKLDLKVGEIYVNGVGEIVPITGSVDDETSHEYQRGMRFESRGLGRSVYRPDGTFELDGKPSRFDLVKIFSS